MRKLRFIFYRILGNDLPPRHRNGQTHSNLKIILEREPEFKDFEKRWIVNRIVDRHNEEKIIKLLDKHSQKYQVIRFDRKRFRKIPVGSYKERLDEMIGLNQARNLALNEGKGLARWVLVFDGNCFFTALSWQEIERVCSKPGNVKYIVVPMLRVAPDGGGIPCEPQVLFRDDSDFEFDENFGYGQDSKVELLRRLGVPGQWDRRTSRHGEAIKVGSSKKVVTYLSAGYVWRLPSGNQSAESDICLRGKLRDRGIQLLMDKIDNEA